MVIAKRFAKSKRIHTGQWRAESHGVSEWTARNYTLLHKFCNAYGIGVLISAKVVGRD